MTDLARLVVKLTAQTSEYERKLDAANRKLDKFEKQTTRKLNSIDRAYQNFTRTVGAALLAVASTQTVRRVIQINDEYARLEGRLRLVTASSQELAAVQSALFDVAQRTRTEYGGVADLYVKLAQTGRELGASQRDLLRFTEGVGNALTVSGSSAQSASGALLQLSQGLAGGVLRAEEFNSVLEGAPEIIRVVAQNMDGMGGSIAKLRTAVKDGEVSSREFFEAFLRGSDDLSKRAQSLPVTVEQAMTRLQNVIKRAVAEGDLSPLVNSINEISDTVSDPRFQQGLATFVSLLAQIPKLSFRGLADIGNAITAMNIAMRRITGAAIDRVEVLRINVERLRKASAFLARNGVPTGATDWLADKLESGIPMGPVGPVGPRGRGRFRPLPAMGEEGEEGEDKKKPAAKIKEVEDQLVSLRDAYADVYEAGRAALQGLETPLETQLRQYHETKFALEQLRDTYPNLAEEATAALERLRVEGLEPIEITTARIPDQISQWSVFAEEAARGMQRAFAQFLFDPFQDGLKGMLAGFIDVVRNMVAELAAQALLTQFFSWAASAAGPGAVGTFLSSLIPRAMGGPVSAGAAYLVGERGPEVFVPGASGRILPNSVGAVTIHQHIDARNADAGLRAMLPGILQRSKMETIAAISDLQRRGRLT